MGGSMQGRMFTVRVICRPPDCSRRHQPFTSHAWWGHCPRPQTETNDYLKTYLCLCTVVFCVHTVYIFISIISNLGMDINLIYLFIYFKYVFVHSLTQSPTQNTPTHPLTHFYFHSLSCFGLNKSVQWSSFSIIDKSVNFHTYLTIHWSPRQTLSIIEHVIRHH